MKLGNLIMIVAAVAVIGVGWAVFRSGGSDGRRDEKILKTHVRKRIKPAVPFDASRFDGEAAPVKATAKAKGKPGRARSLGWPSDWSKADVALANKVQNALDDDDLKATLAAAEKALASENPDVRLLAVEALSWYGSDTVPELTVCMADPNEEVAQAAMGYWQVGVSQMESAKDRVETSILALRTLSDEDALTGISALFSGAANELIDGEEDEAVAFEYRVEVVQWLVDMIDAGEGPRCEAAKEIYSDIAASPWLGIDEAERFVSDPENYEAPDLDEDGNVIEQSDEYAADEVNSETAEQEGEAAAGQEGEQEEKNEDANVEE